MKIEESAGGIVFDKRDGQIFIIVTQHSQHHGWVFPKGLIDKGEDKKSTALREVEEEAGVEAKIIQELPPTEYFYQFQGTKIKKKVIYFLMGYISGDIGDHDWEMEDAQWLLIDEVDEKLSFKSDKDVFQEAKKLIEK